MRSRGRSQRLHSLSLTVDMFIPFRFSILFETPAHDCLLESLLSNMPIGVGSVGDIISICLLAKDLVEALNSSRGAAAEYQEIVRELWGLERALLQVDLLSRTHNSSLELNALHETARRTAENCRVCIAEFLKKIKKYKPSLGETGSGSIFRDASRKIQWQVMQSGDVSKFRAEIGAHSQSISMLLATLSV